MATFEPGAAVRALWWPRRHWRLGHERSFGVLSVGQDRVEELFELERPHIVAGSLLCVARTRSPEFFTGRGRALPPHTCAQEGAGLLAQ